MTTAAPYPPVSATAGASSDAATSSPSWWARIVLRCYEFQELRFTRDELWARFATDCRRLHLPTPRFTPVTRRVYSFTTNARGVVQLVPHPRVTGGAGGTTLRCWTELVPEALVLHVEGAVDLTTASALADAIAQASGRNGGIIVDLSRLDYLDGSGIRVLEHAAQADSGRFVVVGSEPTIHKLFDILELNDVLSVVASIEAAQERLRRSSASRNDLARTRGRDAPAAEVLEQFLGDDTAAEDSR